MSSCHPQKNCTPSHSPKCEPFTSDQLKVIDCMIESALCKYNKVVTQHFHCIDEKLNAMQNEIVCDAKHAISAVSKINDQIHCLQKQICCVEKTCADFKHKDVQCQLDVLDKKCNSLHRLTEAQTCTLTKIQHKLDCFKSCECCHPVCPPSHCSSPSPCPCVPTPCSHHSSPCPSTPSTCPPSPCPRPPSPLPCPPSHCSSKSSPCSPQTHCSTPQTICSSNQQSHCSSSPQTHCSSRKSKCYSSCDLLQ